MDGTVLIADDDRTIRTVLSQAMTRAGMQVHATSSLTTLMRWVSEGRGDLVITDVAMPDGNGIEMIPRISELRPGLPVIVISAQNTVMTAIRANEAAAWDYLPKPFDLPDLMRRSARALEETSGVAPAASIEETQVDSSEASPGRTREAEIALSGRSPEMQHVYQMLARVVNSEIPVLITGNSGCGKTQIAFALHQLGERRNKECAVLEPSITGQQDAEDQLVRKLMGGTLIVDEPGDFSAEEQVRLNRMLARLSADNSQNTPRLVTTSQQNLMQLMSSGNLRQDLYYRLAGIEIYVPPLAARPSDIPVLAEEFLHSDEFEELGPGLGRSNGTARAFAPEAETLLRQHPWPGNVRELKNVIRQLVAVSNGAVITEADVRLTLKLPIHGGTVETLHTSLGSAAATPRSVGDVSPSLSATSQHMHMAAQGGDAREKLADSVGRHLRRYFDLHQDSLPPPGLYQRILKEVEIPLFEIALEATQGNQAKCAELLGINRNTLRKKLTGLDIRVTRGRKMM